jgi:hypothetical protein
MLKGIVGLIIFGFIALAVIILVIINFAYRGIRQMREAAEEKYFREQKKKEQKEKNPFGDDYFKSSDAEEGGARQQRQYDFQRRTTSSPRYQQQQQQYQQRQRQQQDREKETARNTKAADSGVTIIDSRDTEEKRKIFSHNEGEYVEFEEV